MRYGWMAILPIALLALGGCDDENATVLQGTSVETGAPGEFFVRGRARDVMRCVFNDGVTSGRMFDYPIVEGGEIRGPSGWRAIFTGFDGNRVRVVVVDSSGAPNAALSSKMRSWLDDCT